MPLGIALALRLIPAEVMAEHRARSEASADAVIVAIWFGAIALTAWLGYRHLSG